MVKDLIPEGSTIVEIGVFTGEFAKTLLETKPKKLFLVDPWDGVSVSGDADGNNVQPADLVEAYRNLNRLYASRQEVCLIRGRSPPALGQIAIQVGWVDAVYIDGDHSYEGVRKDLFSAYRLMRPGGWIMGHDYEMNPLKTEARYDFGVKRAVDEFCKEKGLTIHAVALDGCVSYAIKVPFEEEFKCPEWGC